MGDKSPKNKAKLKKKTEKKARTPISSPAEEETKNK
ncbi:hypothetical protein AusDCA_1052 [Desulfitobacterium sp. AusDCA]